VLADPGLMAAHGMILQLISVGSPAVDGIELVDVADGLIHIARAGNFAGAGTEPGTELARRSRVPCRTSGAGAARV
jgi:hypothetical protein